MNSQSKNERENITIAHGYFVICSNSKPNCTIRIESNSWCGEQVKLKKKIIAKPKTILCTVQCTLFISLFHAYLTFDDGLHLYTMGCDNLHMVNGEWIDVLYIEMAGSIYTYAEYNR